MKADLHVHSTHSDGTLSPTALVQLAASQGVDVLALADHDSVEGVAEARAAATVAGLQIIPAVELSSVSADGRDVHVLGYFVDDDDSELRQHLTDLREARMRRAQTMVAALSGAGMDVSLDDVLRHAGTGAIGRSHVAKALVGKGHADTVSDAFQRFIGHGKPFYVPKDVRTPEEAIGLIHRAGGVSVMAHPGVNSNEDLIPVLAEAGVDGIEAYHADHGPEQRTRLARLARDMGLLATGGTDYHGPDGPNPIVGSVEVPAECVRALLEAGGS